MADPTLQALETRIQELENFNNLGASTRKLNELPNGIVKSATALLSGEVFDINFGGLVAPDIATPVLNTDGANKAYVDSVTLSNIENPVNFFEPNGRVIPSPFATTVLGSWQNTNNNTTFSVQWSQSDNQIILRVDAAGVDTVAVRIRNMGIIGGTSYSFPDGAEIGEEFSVTAGIDKYLSSNGAFDSSFGIINAGDAILPGTFIGFEFSSDINIDRFIRIILHRSTVKLYIEDNAWAVGV